MFKLAVGIITGLYGTKGLIKVVSYTLGEDKILGYKISELQNNNKNPSVINLKKNLIFRHSNTKGKFICQIAECINRTEAENFVEYTLIANIAEKEITHYMCNNKYALQEYIVTMNNYSLGRILSIQNFGAENIIEIRKNTSDSTFMLPLEKNMIKKICIKTQMVEINYELYNKWYPK